MTNSKRIYSADLSAAIENAPLTWDGAGRQDELALQCDDGSVLLCTVAEPPSTELSNECDAAAELRD